MFSLCHRLFFGILVHFSSLETGITGSYFLGGACCTPHLYYSFHEFRSRHTSLVQSLLHGHFQHFLKLVQSMNSSHRFSKPSGLFLLEKPWLTQQSTKMRIGMKKKPTRVSQSSDKGAATTAWPESTRNAAKLCQNSKWQVTVFYHQSH